MIYREKVKLPRPVADSIEQLRGEGFDNRYIIECSLNDGDPCVLTDFVNDVGFTQLMQALVEGYDVKGTPEDEIRNYYRNNQHNAWEYEDGDEDDPSYHRSQGVIEAVEFVLDELNVKIKGINEEETK
jgi:hypothetical protein